MGAHHWRRPAGRRRVGRLVTAAAAGAALAVLGGAAVVTGVGSAPETSESSGEAVAAASLAAPALRLPAVSVPQLPTDELAHAAEKAEETADKDAAETAAETAAAPRTVRAAAPTRARVPGTPCTATARACADVGTRKAWLIDDGRIVRGPVRIMVGDNVDPTPVGTFHVQWKDKEYTSREYLRQMPYSVFFADGGIAFHEGDFTTPSGGCIKLNHADAVAWFNFLEVGNEVQVVRSG